MRTGNGAGGAAHHWSTFGARLSLGALLTQARLASGRSQLRIAEQLCAASGVPTISRHEISRWERGTRIPTTFWLGWLAHVLNLNLTDLERAAATTRRNRPAATAGPTGRASASPVSRMPLDRRS